MATSLRARRNVSTNIRTLAPISMKDVINEHTKIAVLLLNDVTSSRTENVRLALIEKMLPSVMAQDQLSMLIFFVKKNMITCLPILEMITSVQPTAGVLELTVARKTMPNGITAVNDMIGMPTNARTILFLTFSQKLGSCRP